MHFASLISFYHLKRKLLLFVLIQAIFIKHNIDQFIVLMAYISVNCSFSFKVSYSILKIIVRRQTIANAVKHHYFVIQSNMIKHHHLVFRVLLFLDKKTFHSRLCIKIESKIEQKYWNDNNFYHFMNIFANEKSDRIQKNFGVYHEFCMHSLYKNKM